MNFRTIDTWFLGLLFLFMSASPIAAQDLSDTQNESFNALNSGNYDRVQELLGPVIERGIPDEKEVLEVYFDSYRETGKIHEGLESLESLLRKNPDNPVLLTIYGEFTTDIGRYKEASEAFENADSLQSGYWRNIYSRAQLYTITGRIQEAASFYNILVWSLNNGLLSEPMEIGYAAQALANLDEFRDANEAFITANKIDPSNVVILEWWAELFSEKFNPDQARGNYEDALSINPNKSSLYTGYARVSNSFVKKEELARTALEKNPKNIEARNILAEGYILDSRYQDAELELESALAINPYTVQTLANLASVYHLRDEQDKFNEIVERVIAINPYAGEFYYIIADNSIRRFRYKDAVRFGKLAIEHNRRLWKAYALVGTNLFRIGEVDEAYRYLDRAYNRDPFNLFVSNTLNLIDEYSQFETFESEHFVVILHESESQVLSEVVLDLAETAYDSLSKRYSYKPEGKIRIEGYNDHADFAVRISGLPGISLLGVCFGDVVAFDTPAARIKNAAENGLPKDRYNWSRTLWHEVAHVMALGISDHRVPRWFTEGLSVFEEKRANPAWGREMELQFFDALKNNMLLSLSEMNEGFTRPKYPGQIMMSYYHASRLIEFLSEEYGFTVVSDLLAEFGNGSSLEDAFSTVFDSGSESIDRLFRERMESEMERFEPVLIGLPDIYGNNNEEKSLFDALKEGYVLLSEEDYTGAEMSFREALKLLPNYIEPKNPYEGLAEIYRTKRNTADLKNVLIQYLNMTEYGRDEAIELAHLYKNDGDYVLAEQFFIRSLQIQPYDTSVYNELAELYKQRGETEEEIEQRSIILALNQIDEAEAWYQLGDSLYRNGQLLKAKTAVLRALELSPGFRDAQKLLLKCVQVPN